MDCRVKPGNDELRANNPVPAMHPHPSCCSRTKLHGTNERNKGGEAPKGAYHLPHHRVRRVLSGGRSPSGASLRRLFRRSTARNSVQAALHAMKCEGVTFAWVT